MSIKPEVAEEILGFIGIESAEDLDTFKTEFNSRFVPLNDAHNNPEIQKKVVGKRMTEITSKLTDFGKSVGLDVSFDELAKKKVEDVIGDFKTSISTKITELSEAANSGSDKRVHDLAKQLEEKDKSLNQFKSEWEKTANELRKDDFTGDVKVLTSCPSCLQGLTRFDADSDTTADYIVVEMAQKLLGPDWMQDYVAKANQGGIERVLV